MNRNTFKIIRQNVLTWWKILQSWNFHAFWWKIPLSGKHIKMATCVNNMGKFWYQIFLTSEGGKLLKQEHLQWVSLYCDFVMYYGGRIWTYVQVFSAPTVDHLLYLPLLHYQHMELNCSWGVMEDEVSQVCPLLCLTILTLLYGPFIQSSCSGYGIFSATSL